MVWITWQSQQDEYICPNFIDATHIHTIYIIQLFVIKRSIYSDNVKNMLNLSHYRWILSPLSDSQQMIIFERLLNKNQVIWASSGESESQSKQDLGNQNLKQNQIGKCVSIPSICQKLTCQMSKKFGKSIYKWHISLSTLTKDRRKHFIPPKKTLHI